MDQELLKQVAVLQADLERANKAIETMSQQWGKDIKARNELREQLRELGLEPRA